jgi:AcrR family transcriptional regulator
VADKRQVDGRTERSRRTKRAIVVAATELFVADGYGATSITAIAEQAGVGVQTVYASFGSKRAILTTALDQAIAGDDEAVVVNDRDWMHDVFHAPTAEARLAAYAAACCRIMEGAADVFAVVERAADTDPDVAALVTTTEERRRAGAASVVAAVTQVGELRAGLTRKAAVDVLSLLNGPAVYRHLVRQAGWSSRRYQVWLTGAFVRELLSG